MRTPWVILPLLFAACSHTVAERRGSLALSCKDRDVPECARWRAARVEYDAAVRARSAQLAEMRKENPRQACVMEANYDFKACAGDTLWGSAHRLYEADSEDISRCRHRFDVAAQLCRELNGPQPAVAKE